MKKQTKTMLMKMATVLLAMSLLLCGLISCGEREPHRSDNPPAPFEKDDIPSDGDTQNPNSNETKDPVVTREDWDALITSSENYPTEILLVNSPSLGTADAVTMGTLQGLAAIRSEVQILLRANSYQLFLESLSGDMPEGYGVVVSETDSTGAAWTLSTLLQYYAPMLDGYILCDSDLKKESVIVAINLAHYLNAVVVTSENEQLAKDAGLSLVMDVTDKDDAWLRESEYFFRFNTEVAVEQSVNMVPKLVDYAVMSGCYFNFYNGTNADEHTEMFEFLDEGAVVVGWNNTLGEYQTVQSLSTLNACLIPADHAYNLSTLSGFARSGRVNEMLYGDGKEDSVANVTDEARHTVCFIMSDGDNLQWMMNDFSSGRWYGYEERGSFCMNWGIPALLGDLASPMFQYYVNTQTEKDEFIMQLSGLGYTFPSLWDPYELESMAESLADAMENRGLKYMNVLDDHGFDEEILEAFAKQDAVEGIFYTDYANYAGYGGEILWVDDVPIVSARYRLWAGLEDGSFEAISSGINNAPADVNDVDAYTFIIVHAWSGVDENGNLGGNNCMGAVEKLMSMFDDDVDVVSVSEFMARVKNYLKE